MRAKRRTKVQKSFKSRTAREGYTLSSGVRCLTRRPQWIARITHAVGGAAVASAFQSVVKRGLQDDYLGIKIATPDLPAAEKIRKALERLGKGSQASHALVLRWIKRIIVTDSIARWEHFCDGTVFVWIQDRTPIDVLATYLYKWAIEICLYKRFGFVQVLVRDLRCGLFALRSQRRLMEHLGCDSRYVEEMRKSETDLMARIMSEGGR